MHRAFDSPPQSMHALLTFLDFFGRCPCGTGGEAIALVFKLIEEDDACDWLIRVEVAGVDGLAIARLLPCT